MLFTNLLFHAFGVLLLALPMKEWDVGFVTPTNNSLFFAEYFVLTVEVANEIPPSCFGGSDGVIILNVSGGSGEYSYLWPHDPDLDQSFALNLPAGNFTVTVTDKITGEQRSAAVDLRPPEPITLEVVQVFYPACRGESSGEIVLNTTGGSPPFSAVGHASTWENGKLTISDLTVGDYGILVNDSKGCGQIFTQSIFAPDPLSINFIQKSPDCSDENSGGLQAVVSGGIAPYEITWEDGTTGAELANVSVGSYGVTVRDANDCSLSGLGEVVEPIPTLRMPTGFDPSMGLYEPVSNCKVSYHLMIFSPWGELLYSGGEGWDGQVHGAIHTGVYAYTLEYTYHIGSDLFANKVRGSFTLID